MNNEQNKTEDGFIHMDFSLTTPEARTEKVEEIIANTPSKRLTPAYLVKLADYILFADKQETKKKNILTDNHMVTVNVRETSFEGLIGRLENGEDGIYNMIANDKNIIFKPNCSITKKDLEEVPGLRELRESIKKIEAKAKTAHGREAYTLKKQAIELSQDQYVLRNVYKKTFRCTNLIKSISQLNLTEKVTIDKETGKVESNCVINLFNEKHISLLLCNYSKIKEDSWDRLNSDAKWIIADLENLIDAALRLKHPLYYDLLIYKIDGKQNADIQELLYKKYGIKHSLEYISALWRNKIPKLIAAEAENQYLIWYYTNIEKGYWKRCSRCGQIKLGHNNFFSKNKTSKDGFYSICKECRNKKKESD